MASALDHPTFGELCRHHDELEVAAMITAVVSKSMVLWSDNRRLNGEQIAAVARTIMESWAECTLADLVLFFRSAARGDFDEGKVYGSLDVPLVLGWWRSFLERKADARASRHQSEKAHVSAATSEALAAAAPMLKDTVRRERWRSIRRNMGDMHHVAILTRECGKYTDDELREAWHVFDSAAGRVVIEDEARRRGLMK